jgi:uncharacterized membrane protein
MCTTGDSCQNGMCMGTMVTCNSPPACHAAGSCLASNGTCSYPAVADNTPCNGNLGVCATGNCSTPHYTAFSSFLPTGVSGDGSIVVGNSIGGGPGLWTRSAGLKPLALLTGADNCQVTGISADGMYTVGYCQQPVPSGSFVPVRWMGLNAPIAIAIVAGFTDGQIYATNSTSTVSTGYMSVELSGVMDAALWRSGASPTTLANITGFTNVIGEAINGDGTVIVGSGYLPSGSTTVPRSFIWTQANGMQLIPLPNGTVDSNGANAISLDGTKVVGGVDLTGGGGRAYLYDSRAGTSVTLVYPGDSFSSGWAMSDDGTTAAGTGTSGVWTSINGATPVLLSTQLTNLGVDLTNQSLDSVYDVSADGKVIVGVGKVTGQFTNQGWIAVLK